MGERKPIYRKKVTIAIDVLGNITEKEDVKREDVVETLRQAYEETRLSPFRGVAFPEDIYDKEMATLYIIGKYGMGIDQDFPELFEKVFSKEKKYEQAIETIFSDEEPEKKREKIIEILGEEPTSNELARIFRVLFTKAILGFDEEEKLIEALHQALQIFPEHDKDIHKYARFYIGFKLAEMIATGEIRSKMEKEARKQALNLKVGLGKTMPDDNYIYTIARQVFKVPKQKLLNSLQPRKPQRRQEKESEESEQGHEESEE